MSISDLGMLFQFAGGLGMFLYGMATMADGLQRTAGSRMQHMLGVLTNNRLLGVLAGAIVTAIIQSSSATTVMVVGFVCRAHQSAPGHWNYYGCQYRHHDHQLDCIHERVGGGAETGIFCSVFIFHRSFPCDVHEKPQKEGGR